MAKRETREEKNERVVKTLIDKMFEIAGHNVLYEDIKGRQDAWYTEWTMTEAQNKEWVEWGKKLVKKEYKLTDKLAGTEMAMINLNWGLKFDNQIDF